MLSMEANASWELIAALTLLAVFAFASQRFSARTRAIAGSALFIVGWVGVFIGLALGDRSFLQDETVALVWVGICTLSVVLGGLFLVFLVSECWRKRRKGRHKTEYWRAGHWRD
jgi:ABC-type tungstate transport system substrate-binding protein